MTFLDLRRAHAQMIYKEEVDFIEKNKDELIRQKEKAQEEGMKVRLCWIAYIRFLMGIMLFAGNDGRRFVRHDV
jgi:hypothetical protein